MPITIQRNSDLTYTVWYGEGTLDWFCTDNISIEEIYDLAEQRRDVEQE